MTHIYLVVHRTQHYLASNNCANSKPSDNNMLPQ